MARRLKTARALDMAAREPRAACPAGSHTCGWPHLQLVIPEAGHGLFTVGSAHAVSTVCPQGSFAARCILVEFSDTEMHCAQISYLEAGRI